MAATRAAARRAAPKKTAAKKAPAKRAAPKRAPAKKAPAKRAPAKKATTKKAPSKGAAAKRAPGRTRVVCISHKEDADGISSAALIRQAFGGESVLVDYPGQMEAVSGMLGDDRLKSLYICDLGLSKKTQDEFVRIMGELRKKRVAVTYIDHHDIDPEILRRLEELKVRVIHDVGECTAVQVYGAFRRKLDDHATFVAACAAITDYMEDRPAGSRLLRIYDRQFALISATVLTYNITGHQKDDGYLQELVARLAESRFPHEIPGSFEFAQVQVEKLSQMIAKVKAGLRTTRNLGHMEITDAGASGAVNFVLGLSGRDVGVAYKERVDHGIYAVSVRGSSECKVHLGRIVNALATELGGSGGGHDRACGAVIPKPRIKRFVSELSKRIG